MCVVSMVTDVYKIRWPDPATIPLTDYSLLKELIRKAEEYDRIMKQPECPEPAKADWWSKATRAMEQAEQLQQLRAASCSNRQ